MEASFTLLELLNENSKPITAEPTTAESIGTRAAIVENILALKAAAQANTSSIVSQKSGDSLPSNIFESNFVILCGSSNQNDLIEICENLRHSKTWPLVAVDAIFGADTLHSAFSELETRSVQLARTPAIVGSMKSGRYHIYPYAKPDCTATVCLLFDDATQALVIERLHYPFEGREAFPGGFLRVMMETMEDAAYRELEEECSIKLLPGELTCIDVRSAPGRDPRAHIIDAGYGAVIDSQRKVEILKQLKAGDDASKAHLRPVKELRIPGALAFDHLDFLENTLNHFKLHDHV